MNLKSKIAIITGVSGQDGAYLVQLLLNKGYKVFGTYRRTSSVNFWRLKDLGVFSHPNLELVEFDITDLSCCIRLMSSVQPDEVYNLAAQSFVGVSFQQPITTGEITGLGPVNLLEAIRIVKPDTRFYQASTSEMFGKVQEIPQKESTPFYPRSPYGVAKLYAHWMVINYMESYNLFATSGILFNHESPLRGLEFVTRKITDGVAKVKLGLTDHIELGNLDAKRDWGHARDYVEGMWSMLQQDKPGVYVLATNRTVTVRDFVNLTFKAADIDVEWRGTGINEVAVSQQSGEVVVKINPMFFRPAEVELLIGDSTYAANQLGWVPQTTLEDLCREMYEADLERNANGISI